jgi:hypothetical protein
MSCSARGCRRASAYRLLVSAGACLIDLWDLLGNGLLARLVDCNVEIASTVAHVLGRAQPGAGAIKKKAMGRTTGPAARLAARRSEQSRCALCDRPWDPSGNGCLAWPFRIRPLMEWLLLAVPGVRWRLLTHLARVLISRFSVRFRVGP